MNESHEWKIAKQEYNEFEKYIKTLNTGKKGGNEERK